MIQKDVPYPSLDTPCVLLDLDKLESNIGEMSRLVVEAGVKLRPHIKVHQCADIAKMQLEAGACGVEVGIIAQAEAMAEQGINDIIIAHPNFYSSQKQAALKKLLSKSALKLAIVIDMLEQAEGISHVGQEINQKVPILLKIDTNRVAQGGSRFGVLPGKTVLQLSRRLTQLPGIEFRGIYAHEMGGGGTPEGVENVSWKTAEYMSEMARMLKQEDIRTDHVSVGSSPTFRYTCRWLKEGKFSEITEIHPGNCAIGDIMYMRSLGNIRETCALTVLTTVMSTTHPSWAMIDSGYKTFGNDSLRAAANDPNFTWNGKPAFGSVQGRSDLWLGGLSAESATITYIEPEPKRLSLGERVEIVPNNATLVINIHDTLYGVRNISSNDNIGGIQMGTGLQLKLLSPEDVSGIYEKTLGILSTKGVKVNHTQALKILDKAGAVVSFDDQQVKFPKEVIEWALQTVPHQVTIASSDGNNDMILPHPNGKIYGGTCIQSMRRLNPDSDNYEDFTLKTVAEWYQLIDALDGIDSFAIITASDVPEETSDIHGLKVAFENCSKAITLLAYSLESVEYLFELMLAKAGSEAALGKRPMLRISPTSFTPFEFKPMDMEEIIQACRYGVPLYPNSLPISGGTAPITIAGTVLLSSVEQLAMLVMAQLMNPGHPVIGCGADWTIDMLTGKCLMGSVEGALCKAATIQFVKDAFHIPVASSAYSDAYLPDGQAMIEKTLKGLLLAMAGNDSLEIAGRTGAPNTASPVALIMDSNLVNIINRVKLGVKVDDDTLALKDLLDTAPGTGHFMDRAHTLKHCREALRPELFMLPRSVEIWEAEGRKDLYARAVDKYREMKKELQPEQLPEEVQKEMNLIAKRADERLAR
jgi:trimethylamine--corrinoid protein Co-methyltransferase